MRGMHRIGIWEIPTSGIVAAILFTLAHIGFTFSQFAITYFDPLQLFGAFGFGLFFAIIFHRTGSLLGPIILHGYSNLILNVARYSTVFLFSWSNGGKDGVLFQTLQKMKQWHLKDIFQFLQINNWVLMKVFYTGFIKGLYYLIN